MTVDDAKKLLLETIGYQVLAARLDASVNRDAINRDIDAYGESVRADERERHEEMIIAFEGHGIAADSVIDGYSYSADVVRQKIAKLLALSRLPADQEEIARCRCGHVRADHVGGEGLGRCACVSDDFSWQCACQKFDAALSSRLPVEEQKK